VYGFLFDPAAVQNEEDINRSVIVRKWRAMHFFLKRRAMHFPSSIEIDRITASPPLRVLRHISKVRGVRPIWTIEKIDDAYILFKAPLAGRPKSAKLK